MKKIIHSTNAPAAVGPYSQAMDCGDFVFLSGQIPLDPQTGLLVEGGLEAQATQIFKNIQAVLLEAGMDFSHVVKSTVFLTDLGNFAPFNEIYGSYFPENPPARSCVEVSALPKACMVEVEIIAKR